jgi:hypothetical protein
MKTETQYPIRAVAIALVMSVVASGVSLPVFAEDTNYTDVTDIARYQGWGDPAMAAIAVNSGRALINHLLATKALLEGGDVEQARSALVASREFADAIGRMMPYLVVVEEMQDVSDGLVQEKIEALSTDLLPIYASIDEMTVYAPEVAIKTRGMLKQAEKHASSGDSKQAAKVLREAASEVSEHTVYLPVSYVEQQVRVAQNALSKEKPDVPAAQAAVNRSLDSLKLVVEAVVQTAAN